MRLLAKFHCLQIPVSVTFKEGWLDRFENFLKEFPGSNEVWEKRYLDLFDKNPRLKDLRKFFLYIFVYFALKLNLVVFVL